MRSTSRRPIAWDSDSRAPRWRPPAGPPLGPWTLFATVVALGCTSSQVDRVDTGLAPASGPVATGGASEGDHGPGLDDGSALDESTRGAPPQVPAHCGDGRLDEDEACDDGNRDADDGCQADCRALDAGFICPRPGEPCTPFAKCGDGVVFFPEQCDDGNETSGDGCSSFCKTEIGSKCEGTPSTCTETICGDGLVEGAEGCDDANPVPFDGCDEACQWEPSCASAGDEEGCSSFCGDGILWGDEACDDGNVASGDGCSSECEAEAGFTCETAPCDMVDDECVLRVTAVYRDFLDAHPNFACGGGTITLGLVEPGLDDEGKPIYTGGAGPCLSDDASMEQWYRAGDDHSTVIGELVLFENGSNGFVNRFGPGSASYVNSLGAAIDGTPLFFPLDAVPVCTEGAFGCARADTTHLATIPGEPDTYEPPGWVAEEPPRQHNFSFTTEVGYWFEYDPADPPVLDFLGDDDVWVFVNGRLAVDLGGLHVPLAETLTLDDATNTALALGLVSGNVYPIHVFHAERNPTGSSFRLTLSGFRTERSLCLPNCGDGMVAAGEECDDGMNDGGHNECQPGCVLATFCGDGVVQRDEQCDDAAPDAPANCAGCRLIPVL